MPAYHSVFDHDDAVVRLAKSIPDRPELESVFRILDCDKAEERKGPAYLRIR